MINQAMVGNPRNSWKTSSRLLFLAVVGVWGLGVTRSEAVIILPESVDWSRNGYLEPHVLQEQTPEAPEPAPEPIVETGPRLRVTLKEAKNLPEGLLRLKDLAVIQCEEPELLEQVEAIELFDKPGPGEIEYLYPRRVEAALRHLGLGSTDFAIDGLDRLVIETPSQEVKMEEIERAITEALYARSIQSQPGDVEVFLIHPPSVTHLPPGDLRIEVMDLDRPGSGIRNVQVAYLVDGVKVDTQTVSVRVNQMVYGLVAAHDLQTGQILSDGDIKEGLVPYKDPTSHETPLTDASQVVGGTLKRGLRAEAPIEVDQVEFEPILRQGAPVTLIQAIGSVRLSAPGVLVDDVYQLGQRVRVRKTNSRGNILGKALNLQTVLVE